MQHLRHLVSSSAFRRLLNIQCPRTESSSECESHAACPALLLLCLLSPSYVAAHLPSLDSQRHKVFESYLLKKREHKLLLNLPPLPRLWLLGLGFSWPGRASHNNFRNLVGRRDWLPSPAALNNFQFESTAPSAAPSNNEREIERGRMRERSSQVTTRGSLGSPRNAICVANIDNLWTRVPVCLLVHFGLGKCKLCFAFSSYCAKGEFLV